MAKFVNEEKKCVVEGEQVFINQTSQRLSVMTGIVFNKDGEYSVSVHEGRTIVTESPVKYGKWIPFNEQKPKRAYTLEYLVTVKKGEDHLEVIIARWSSCGWGSDIYDAFCCPQQVTINNRPMYAYQPIPSEEVVAWMPLPSPYLAEMIERKEE